MSVFMMLTAVSSFFKWRSLVQKADIDGFVFKMHYKITAAVLIGCSLMVTANHLIGNPISCITSGSVPGHVINTFCWISYTYTLPDLLGKEVGTHVAHPGIGPDTDDNRVRYHSYYQWVPFMLFFQGVMFYAPHWFWKILEGGKMQMITEGVRASSFRHSEDRRNSQQKIVQYLIDSLHLHNLYAFGYVLCEVLNFLNVIINIFLINWFLNGEFMSYGTKVLAFSQMEQEERNDPMIAVFPRLTKCRFHKFGPSGTIQTHDALCVLALNILNEKIYIFLWFWLIFLAIVSGVALGYNLTVMFHPLIKQKMLHRRFKYGTRQAVSTLITKTQLGDVLLLDLLSQNMNLLQFKEVLEELSFRLHRGDDNLSSTAGTSDETLAIFN